MRGGCQGSCAVMHTWRQWSAAKHRSPSFVVLATAYDQLLWSCGRVVVWPCGRVRVSPQTSPVTTPRMLGSSQNEPVVARQSRQSLVSVVGSGSTEKHLPYRGMRIVNNPIGNGHRHTYHQVGPSIHGHGRHIRPVR